MRLITLSVILFATVSAIAIPRYEVELEFNHGEESIARTTSADFQRIDDQTWLWEGLESLGDTEINQSVRYIELEDGFEIRLRLQGDSFDVKGTTGGSDSSSLYEYSTTTPQLKIDDGTGTEWVPTFKIRSVDSRPSHE